MERTNGEWDGYVFPAIVTDATPKQQAEKIEEGIESFRRAARLCSWQDDDEVFDPLGFKSCVALLDVLHACETMLRMYDQDIVDACAHIVLARNAVLGRYGEVQ